MGILYFISPFVFLVLAIIFPFFITDKIPPWLSVNIGKLNAEDIRNMDETKRANLRIYVGRRFGASVIATYMVSLIFTVISPRGSAFFPLACNMTGLAVGLIIANPMIIRGNAIKAELEQKSGRGNDAGKTI